MHSGHRRRNLGYFFGDALARVPDKVAIIDLFGDSERCTTYRALDARMDGVARMLVRLGVRPGDRVAMLVGNRTEFVEFFFGSMRAGAIPLPLNTRLAAGMLTDIIRGAACVLALIDPSSHKEAIAVGRGSHARNVLLLDEFPHAAVRLATSGPTSDARTPSPQPKSDLSDLGHFKSAELGQARVRVGEGWGEGGQHSEIRSPSPGSRERDPTSPLRGEVTQAATPRDDQMASNSALAGGFLSYEEEMAKPAPPVEPPELSDDAQAFQPYTSGSTGRPKGAIMTHRGMLWYVAYNQRYWPSAESDRGLIALPLFHKNALRGTVKPMLYAGGSFVLMPGYEPRAYLEALAKYRCTYSRGVAAVFTMFLQHRDYLDSLDLSALRAMTIGSAVVTPELLDAVERALPHIKVSESYGLTEGGSPLRAPIDGRPVPRGSPGVQAPEVDVRLVDANGRDADEGELLIRCPYVCLGYYNEPRITREKLDNGWLRTGDIFCKDQQGFFYFRSRVDDMFSCGGENIYPKEVENLLFAHPDVVNAVVAPVPHAVKGFAPAAMVMVRKGSTVTADELKAYCLEHGPAYSHPRFIDIVAVLPLNGAGKIDRGAVQAKLSGAYGARAGEVL